MAHNIAFTIPFKNRQLIDCEVEILGKDWYLSPVTLEGSIKPAVLGSDAQANQIPYGIKATAFTIEFYAQAPTVTLTTFYSEDDDFWMVRFKYNGSYIWHGFLQIDNSDEPITDQEYTITLSANDGLGRLENQFFYDNSLFGQGKPFNLPWRLDELLGAILSGTGLDLETKAWLNIYENSTEDRSDFNYLTFLTQTVAPTKYFINEDGTTLSFYEVLNNVMLDFRCLLVQAEGCWQIIRWGDMHLWADGTMPGTLYDNGFSVYELILFPNPVDIGRGLSVHPINENQRKTILRPYEWVKETFNYVGSNYIVQANLQIPPGAVPYDTSTTDGIRTDKYALATYFTDWIQRNGDASYLTVVTDTNVDPEQEIDRYIHKPADFDIHSGVQFNPLPVSEGDTFDFSLQFRTQHTDGFFWVRYILITSTGEYWSLEQDVDGGSPDYHAYWDGPFSADDWFNHSIGVRVEKDGEDDTWAPYQLSQFMPQGSGDNATELPIIPADGFLLIEVDGNSSTWSTGFGTYQTDWKDIKLTLNQFINGSISIVGQTHYNAQSLGIKNNESYEVHFDDSHRSSIKGTLFTDALTNYEYTDDETGEETDLGNQFTTRTHGWHRGSISEAKRLGELNTFNDLFTQQRLRTIISGDFFGLAGVSLMSAITFDWLPTKRFIFGAASFDYMECIWNGTLYELYDTDDSDPSSTYTFNYIYDTGQ